MNTLTATNFQEEKAYRALNKQKKMIKLKKSAGVVIASFIMFNFTKAKKDRLIQMTR